MATIDKMRSRNGSAGNRAAQSEVLTHIGALERQVAAVTDTPAEKSMKFAIDHLPTAHRRLRGLAELSEPPRAA